MPKIKNSRRQDGRIQSKVYLGNGKYKYVYATTNKELQAKIDEVKVKLGKGIDVSAQRDTFDFWGQKWLKYKRPDVSENWYQTLSQNYKKLEPLYNMPISKIMTTDLKDILLDLAENNYSQHLVQIVRDIASGVMRLAFDCRVIEYNPFERVQLPKTKPPEKRRALTSEEQQWIIDTPHRAQTAAMIMMLAGLRRGELIPLQWSDIDFEHNTISVSKSVEFIGNNPNVKSGGKTDAATRIVAVPQLLIDYLSNLPRASFLVCPNTHGSIHTKSSWRKLWDSYIRDLNIKYGDFGNSLSGKTPKSKYDPKGVPIVIPKFTPHYLRHTFITLMYLAGVDVITAAAQAGHSDVSVTMKIYTHLDEQYRDRAAEKIDKYFADGCQMGVRDFAK